MLIVLLRTVSNLYKWHTSFSSLVVSEIMLLLRSVTVQEKLSLYNLLTPLPCPVGGTKGGGYGLK